MSTRHRTQGANRMVEFIGQGQRRNIEQGKDPRFGYTVEELSQFLEVSQNTIRTWIAEAKRIGHPMDSRSRGSKSPTAGTPISGRPAREYFLIDGHLWAGLGRKRDHAVAVGPRGVIGAVVAGRYDGMPTSAIKLALAQERRDAAIADGTAWMSSALGHAARWVAM